MQRRWPAFVSLDATNTLFRVRGSVGQHYAQAAAEFGVHLQPSLIARGFTAAYREANSSYPNFGYSAGITSYDWWWSVVAKSLAHAQPELALNEEFAHEVFPKLFDQLWNDFTKPESWEVFPDTEAAIKMLRQQGIKVGLISNWDERLPLVLKNLGWHGLFDVVLTSRAFGALKPDHEIFYQALRMADAEAPEAVHVGDDYNKDYRGALNAGFSRAFWIRRSTMEEGRDVPPDDVLHDLNGLLKALGLPVPPEQPNRTS